MTDIDRSQVNFEPLQDADNNNTTAKVGSAKRSGFSKKNNGPWLKGGKSGKGPSSKVSKATKTSGKFGGVKSSGKPQGKGSNKAIR